MAEVTAITLTRRDPARNLHRYYRLGRAAGLVRRVVLHPGVGPHRPGRADSQRPLPYSARRGGGA
jgi:hypothetical protein